MKNLKRILALALCCAFLLGTAAFAADTPSSWAAAEVNAAIAEGLVLAELQKNYTQPVSRGAVARMFVNLLEKSSGKTSAELLAAQGAQLDRSAFTDTSDEAVLVCSALGLINGVGNGRFDPEGTLTRGQIAAIMNRAARVLGFSTDNYPHGFTDTRGSWVDAELGWAKHAGIISGVGGDRFDPDGKLTVEQAIVITYRALKGTTEMVWVKVKDTWTRDFNPGDPHTASITWTYDEHGNNVSAKCEDDDGSTRLFTYGYNEYGDMVVERGWGKFDYVYTYGADGSVETKSYTGTTIMGNAASDTVTYGYDSRGRLVSEGNTRYEYDENGLLVKKIYASGEATEYIYDGGRLVKEISPRNTTEYSYDGDRLVMEKDSYSTITYSNFDEYGNPRRVDEVWHYDSGDYLVSHIFEYEPVKKALLPLHWAGTNTDGVYVDTIG